MNEHIQELISAYLHPGSTPEQEKELFEACRNDPEAAEHLRQHLIMSLKLRRLRDDVTVSSELHASLERRIDAIDLPEETEEVQPVAVPVTNRGLRLAHLFGTGLATAAAAVILVLLLPADPEPGLPSETAVLLKPSDTVYVIERDTVRQIREIERPVYIVRNAPAESDAEQPGVPGETGQVATALDTAHDNASEAAADETASVTEERDEVFAETPSGSRDATEEPLFVDARPSANAGVGQKTRINWTSTTPASPPSSRCN